MPYRPLRGSSPRLALASAAAVVLLLPALPIEAGIGREAWEDPSVGPFRDNPQTFWAAFVLNLEDPRCDTVAGPLGTGDATIAFAVRAKFLAAGVPADHIVTMVSRGNALYPAASETNLRNWIASVASEANAATDSRVFFMLSGHGVPYALSAGGGTFSHPLGSTICLNGGQEMSDGEFAGYIGAFAPHVELGLAASCSLCGGFADRVYGPVDAPGTPLLRRNGLVSTVGCGIASECFGHRDSGGGSYYHILWSEGLVTGAADGWTGLARNDVMTPYDSRERDGRVTLEEAYWYALGRSPANVFPQPGFAFLGRFQMRDGVAGGFVLTSGALATTPNEGTGDCVADTRDYDGDAFPNAVDVFNGLEESLEAVALGGYVATAQPTNSAFRLVVTSPSGNSATFISGKKNMSLDGFAGEPVDGTWVFDLRGTVPNENVLEVGLNGKRMRDNHTKLITDVGVIAWNWHAESRTDDSPVLDVDPCPATGLRFYSEVSPSSLA